MAPSDITIRTLGVNDWPLLEKVAADVFDNPVDPVLAREFLNDPRHHLVVALDDHTIVGIASGFHYVHPDKPAQLFVNEIGVAPTHQRRGIAKRMLRALLDEGRSVGCREAWVGTELDNAPARALYRAARGDEDATHFALYTFDLQQTL